MDPHVILNKFNVNAFPWAQSAPIITQDSPRVIALTERFCFLRIRLPGWHRWEQQIGSPKPLLSLLNGLVPIVAKKSHQSTHKIEFL